MGLLKADTMPTEGQFIQVWGYGGDTWAYTLKWEDDVLLRYNTDDDDWEIHDRNFDDTDIIGHWYLKVE